MKYFIFIFALMAYHQAIAQSCPEIKFLESYPNSAEGPDWSEQAQGIATDGRHWYFTNPKRIYKYRANWRSKNGSSDPGKIASAGIPKILEERYSTNHYGDIDVFGKYIFVPFEGEQDGRRTGVIAVLSASDFRLLDYYKLRGKNQDMGWLAYHPKERALYTSESPLDRNGNLDVYKIDLKKIENGKTGDFITGKSTKPVYERNGSRFKGKMSYMQGGDFAPNGDLFLIVGKSDSDPKKVRGGIHLLRKNKSGGYQLLQSSHTRKDNTFSYRYAPNTNRTPILT